MSGPTSQPPPTITSTSRFHPYDMSPWGVGKVRNILRGLAAMLDNAPTPEERATLAQELMPALVAATELLSFFRGMEGSRQHAQLIAQQRSAGLREALLVHRLVP